jgi:hypothetical protein
MQQALRGGACSPKWEENKQIDQTEFTGLLVFNPCLNSEPLPWPTRRLRLHIPYIMPMMNSPIGTAVMFGWLSYCMYVITQ